jgi:hypothetical protein
MKLLEEIVMEEFAAKTLDPHDAEPKFDWTSKRLIILKYE